MNRLLLRTKARLRDAAKPVAESRRRRADGRAVAHHALFRSGQDREFLRPRHPLHRTPAARRPHRARESEAAFPEKSPEEIETILAGVWDNLGRIGAEFAHLDHIWDYDSIIRTNRAASNSARGPSRLFDAPARRRQARDDLREPSRQLGIAGAWRGRARARLRDPVPPAEHRIRRPRHRADPRGQDGHADAGRPRRAAQARGSPAKRPARRHAGRSVS